MEDMLKGSYCKLCELEPEQVNILISGESPTSPFMATEFTCRSRKSHRIRPKTHL